MVTHLGPGWAAYRARHSLEVRTGALRRKMPRQTWDQIDLSCILITPEFKSEAAIESALKKSPPKFIFTPGEFTGWRELFGQFDSSAAVTPEKTAEEIRRGTFTLFSRHKIAAGFPPDWHSNLASKHRAPDDRHFSLIGDFSCGDIKWIWEPSRFSFVFPLVRAFARTGDQNFAETFWLLFEDWYRKNPPNTGANWKCGQETALRLFAWIFGFCAFVESPHTTSTRVSNFYKAVYASAERIRAHIDYALSQRNNHGISEAAGLFVTGLMFPQFREAEKWEELGRRHLEHLVSELFYDDGSFSQHSFNYQRVAMQDLLFCLRLADLHEATLSEVCRKRLLLAAEFLHNLQDSQSGLLPNYGHNDGALVFPLTNCDYNDFRPLLQAYSFLGDARRFYSNGPWDEETLWFFGAEALKTATQEKQLLNFKAEEGGYFTFRGANSFAFVRCASFWDRPSQADMLHLDLWYKGQNIAIDPGTFSYNAPSPWNNALGATEFHNTITIGGRSQMTAASKFLWLPWLKSTVNHDKGSKLIHYFEGEHDGYSRQGATHARAVVHLPDDIWVVLDRVQSREPLPIRLHWLFPREAVWDAKLKRASFPSGYSFQFFTANASDTTVTLVEGDEHSPRGWISRYYYDKTPAKSFAVETSARQTLFCSVFSPVQLHAEWTQSELILTGGTFRAEFNIGGNSVLSGITLRAPHSDSLIISE